ncbi:MAG TPA: isoleucine--tRNA ligase [Bacillota bacterium]|jgi:isoleucyl-tRNA synthetase|nr:isoleucine--tRNA ligase [Fastidiosipila sp.]HPX93123.1 isoleucine--tRNA ligase [Bacillota bacterium]HQB81366.1 isoleucine--tRNA ligase [Bacillota bacterium]
MYEKVDSSLDFVPREKKILAFWKEHDIFKKSMENRQGAPIYSFYDGPPTANGMPHAGHVLTRVIKDLIPRYRTMKGFYVPRKAGWDTHGLPVELEVERRLGLDGKDQIEAYGVEAFIRECKKSVWKYKGEWEEMSERIGFWADMEHPYITYENDYIESVWWSLKQIWDKGLIYQGHKVVPYCPRCGTSLSSHEVAQGYRDISERSVYVRFRAKDQPDTYYAVWTTTPWTLPSNVALCVNANEYYVLCEVDGEPDGSPGRPRYIIARELCHRVFGQDARILETYLGSDLLGREYEPLYTFGLEGVEKSGRKAYFLVSDPYVTLTDGTGIVHIAPAFGEDDARIGRANDLPMIQLVAEDGTMTEEVEGFAGVFVKDADDGLVELLRRNNLLLSEEMTEHTYPFCWRCDTPLIYYARTAWFIEMTKLRGQLLENNDKINWIPAHIGPGRFGHFLESVIDWCISRERYWGTPLPVWQCESCGHLHMVGSIAEMKAMSPGCPEDIELHKPMIDQVHLTCPACSKTMSRVPEVIDGWYDSGAMPYAQYHYPFENEELTLERMPADFISEAIDQTRGWFYSLHAISTALFDEEAYRTCLVLGHVLDKDGIKMSKHLGNIVEPGHILDLEGADAMRWMFYSGSQPWLSARFSEDAVNEAKRRFMGTFWNTYAFFILYANIDRFDPADYQDFPLDEFKTVMDRWIESRLHSLIREVDHRLEVCDVTTAARALESFVEDLSNWYVRRSRERYWGPDMDTDKITAYLVLHHVLSTMAYVIAPFTPFMAETVYLNLVADRSPHAPESVHMCDYPAADEDRIDKALEAEMERVLELVSLGRAARNNAQLKIRQPLAEMVVVGMEPLSEELSALVRDELNIKDLRFDTDDRKLIDYSFKPQLRTLGRRMGGDLQQARSLIEGLPGRATMEQLEEGESIQLAVGDKIYDLSLEDLLVEEIPAAGYAIESAGGIKVALSTVLSEALIEEGFVREMVSKIQTMRRSSGFEVTDRIHLYVGRSEQTPLIDRYADAIMSDVLADQLIYFDGEDELPGGIKGQAWDINGHSMVFAVRVPAGQS